MTYRESARAILQERLSICEDRKIFCLSLPKSGTTSFQTYLADAGLTVAGSGVTLELIKEPQTTQLERFCEALMQRLRERDGFQDQPWGFFADVYREKFPNARYVILSRTFESWFKSFRFHILGKPTTPIVLREFLGVPSESASEETFRRAYEAHDAFCAAATRGAPSLTIRIDLEDDVSICRKLNDFLGLSGPKFPHLLQHQNLLLFRVRTALGEGRRNAAAAVLEQYLAIHGDDKACARAQAMIDSSAGCDL
jgi:hypothetical protein